MKKITPYQITTILITIITLTINGLANALPLNNLTTGEISDQFAIYFVPAGYVFSIWGLIYLGMLAFTVYQALPAQRDNQLIRKISPAYWIASLGNTVWIFLWHYQIFPLTPIAILTTLLGLIYIYVQISKHGKLKTVENWVIRIPFSIYVGWLSVAVIANISQVLYYFDWDGFGLSGPVWAAIMLTIATILGIVFMLREKNWSYILVFVWAFIGIAIKHSATELVNISAIMGVVILLSISAGKQFNLLEQKIGG